MATNAIAPITTASESAGARCIAPASTAGRSRNGITATVVNWRMVKTVIPDAAVVVSTPDSLSMRTCNVAPAAAPAGTMELSAFPASCDVTIENHSLVLVASRSSIQTIRKLAASHATTTAIQPTPTVDNFGNTEKASTTLGSTK